MSEMIQIPEGWEEISLDKACHVLMGQSPDGHTINQSGKGYPFLQGNAEFGKKYPSEKNWTTNSTRIAEKDSILLSVRAPVGALNIADKNYCIGRGLSSLTYKNRSLEYLYFVINHNKHQFKNLSQGSTFEAINRKNIEELNILAPKLEKEQQKIAEVLSEVDNAILKAEELLGKNKRIKTALMQDLLSYGVDEKGKIRSPLTHNFKPSELGNIPDEWDVKKTGDLCDSIVPSRDKPKSFTGDIPWVTTPEISDYEIIKNHHFVYGLTKDEIKRVNSKIVPKNSIIMTCVGDLGICALTEIDIVINQQLHAFLPRSIDKLFLLYSLSNQKNQMKSLVGLNVVPYMNKNICESILIKYPKLETEQQKIAQILLSQDQKIEDIKKKLNKLKSLKASLMQDLLSGKKRVTKLMENN